MICISIAQESRRFALVDMLNSARQCDLLEVRLDRFGKAPEIAELLAAKPKPVILSCRRAEDGGAWEGSEDERLMILRQCVMNKADYVEIELDAADQIRPFPPSKRVISYYNLHTTPPDLADIYSQMQKKKPDVIKLVTLARTPEEAWPLVQILARPAVPTVVVGLGKIGRLLAVLGRKIGAPWTYAALERGMEAYPDQPTVSDLNTIYHYPVIEKSTKLVGVTGTGPAETVTVALLNAAFAHLKLNARCLPLEVGSMRMFFKIVEAIKLATIVLGEDHRRAVARMVHDLQGSAAKVQAAELIAHRGDKWTGYYLWDRAVIAALENALRARNPGDKPLEGRIVMLVGLNEMTHILGAHLTKMGAMIILASRDRDGAKALASELSCRYVQFEAVYTTLHDVLIYCCDESDIGLVAGRTQPKLHAGYLKPSMTVLDLTSFPRKGPLTREAEIRGCNVVQPRALFLDHTLQIARLIAGKEVPAEPLREVFDRLMQDEEE